MAGGSAPRYAPDDPSIAPPWKALVDGNTGYIYYWNTETNITQYEKPSCSPSIAPLPPVPPPPPAGGPKQVPLHVEDASGVPGSKMPERRSSRMLSSTGASYSSRVESAHPVGSPQHKSSRFSSDGKQMSGSPEEIYGHSSGSMPTLHQRQHVSEHHGRNMVDNHGRFIADHQNRSAAADHHSGPISDSRPMSGGPKSNHHNRSGPESHGGLGGHLSDHHTRSMPDSHVGHIPDLSRSMRDHPPEPSRPMRDHRGGHALENRSWTMPDHHMSRPGHASTPRSSGHVVPGGSIHASASNSSWGGSSGRQAPGSTAGSTKGIPFTRSNPDAGGSWGAAKVAALPIPQHQQRDMGGMHYSDQPRQVGRLNSPFFGRSSIPATPTGAFKRTAPDHPIDAPDTHKRPRFLQAFSEPSSGLDPQTYQLQHEITVVGENVPPPFTTFELGNFPPELMRELRTAGFAAPTPIQAQAWPIALQARDVIAIAKTGSGKTLGYLLPAFLKLMQTRAHSRAGPIVLVLAPTRELATQIQDEAMKFGKSSRITSTCVYGGAPKGPQLRDLERGADIVIATPGRLNDFLEVRKINLRQVSYLVLDEADRMLDMGFEPQIRKIVNEIPSSRQTLMFTATWPREVRRIAADLLVNPVQVNIGNSDELTANKAITQHVEVVQPFHKQKRLEEILRNQQPGSKVIIFCSTKKMCDQLARSLSRGFQAVAIHGDKSQNERDHVLTQFKAGRSPILVATDVAARGLDVKDIRIVINYDFPTGVEDYVHRIGRTGRAGATGEAFTFFSEHDAKYARELIKILEGADQRVPMELRQLAGRGGQQSQRRPRWQSGGTSMVDELFGSRSSVGHRPMGIVSRDTGAGLVRRDDRTEAAGRWGSTDGGIGDKGVGAVRGVVGERVGRDARIGSRVESVVIRESAGSGSQVVRARREDVNGAVAARGGGRPFISRDGGNMSSREGGFGLSKGAQDDGLDDTTCADDDDGWGDGGGGSSGTGSAWGQGPRGGSQSVGHAENVKPPAGEHDVGGRREGWGEEGRRMYGSGRGRGLYGPSGRRPERGRVFYQLGEQGRSFHRDARTDMHTDGRVHDGDDPRRSLGKKDGAGRSRGGYNDSPVKGSGANRSGSPRRKVHNRSRSRSRSRTPRVGSHGNRIDSPSHALRTNDRIPRVGLHGGLSRSPNRVQRTDDCPPSSREGPRLMSTISPIHHSPDKSSCHPRQHLKPDPSQGKASRKGEPASTRAELKGVLKDDQVNIPTTKDTALIHVKDQSLVTGVAPSLENKSDREGEADQGDAEHDSLQTEPVLQDHEGTQRKGQVSPITDVTTKEGAGGDGTGEADPLLDKAYEDAVMASSKEDDAIDNNQCLSGATSQVIKAVNLADSDSAAAAEQHATSQRMPSPGKECHDDPPGFVARPSELSDNHINEAVICSPEEGKVL